MEVPHAVYRIALEDGRLAQVITDAVRSAPVSFVRYASR
jgi:hypothetical protein